MGTKIGFQTQRLSAGVDAAIRCCLPYFKVISADPPDVRELVRLHLSLPDCRVIWRCYWHGQRMPGSMEDALELAYEYRNRIRRARDTGALEHIWAVEAHSEGFAHGYDLSEEQCQYLDHYNHNLLDLLFIAAPRLQVIAGNFGAGNGDGQWWLSRFPRTVAYFQYFGFQEYDWPSLFARTPYYLLRYRDQMEAIRSVNPTALALITEGGITHATDGGPDHGYKTVPDMTDMKFVGQLAQLSGELDRDPYLLHFSLFGCEMEQDPQDPDRWGSFDVAGTPVLDWIQMVNTAEDGGSPVTSQPQKELYDVSGPPQYVLGFEDYADQHPEIGAPVTNQITLHQPDGRDVITFQEAEKALLVYLPGSAAFSIPKAL